MLYRPLTLVIAGLAVMALSAPVAIASDSIDLSGMDCSEQATQLRSIIDHNETDADEADQLNTDVTTAQTACMNDEPNALSELATRLEGRQWNLDSDTFEN